MENENTAQNNVFMGKHYRITVLSERLIRLEYSNDGNLNDLKTLLVKNRDFSVPEFKVEQDERYIAISTKYFSLQYAKEKPFIGSKFAPEANLKIKLLNTDKQWYYQHPEAKNFKADAFSLDDYVGKVNLLNGLYSTDGFATIDDSNTMLIDEENNLIENNLNNTDIYVFMYKRDVG